MHIYIYPFSFVNNGFSDFKSTFLARIEEDVHSYTLSFAFCILDEIGLRIKPKAGHGKWYEFVILGKDNGVVNSNCNSSLIVCQEHFTAMLEILSVFISHKIGLIGLRAIIWQLLMSFTLRAIHKGVARFVLQNVMPGKLMFSAAVLVVVT